MKRLILLLFAAFFAFALFAERLELKTATSGCTVETVGARILSLRLAGRELLWNDDPVQTTDPVWAHGGIPIAWPWFGRLKPDEDANIHGTAWRREFTVVAKEEGAEKSRLVLALKGEEADLEYRLELGDAAKLTLVTRNPTRKPVLLSMAFHPYFAVGERDRVTVEGAAREPIPFVKAMDDTYEAGASGRTAYRIVDASLGRTIVIECSGGRGVNLWNPGPEKKCPGTIPGESWRRFVCIEPILGGDDRFVKLAPGECCEFAMGISVAAPRPAGETGVLVLSFDDRNFEGWEKALPLFAKYNAHATFFVSGPIDSAAIKALKKLVAAGHTAGLHGLCHANADEAIAQKGAERYFGDDIAPQQDAIRRAGIPCSNFAYPNSRRCDASDALFLSKGFARVRGGVKGATPYDPAGVRQKDRKPLVTNAAVFFPASELPRRRRLDTIILGDAYHTDLNEILACLDRIAAKKEVLSITSHDIAPGAKHIHMKTEWLEAILGRAQELGIPVLGFDELPPVEN